jgi:hypothetical protein
MSDKVLVTVVQAVFTMANTNKDFSFNYIFNYPEFQRLQRVS